MKLKVTDDYISVDDNGARMAWDIDNDELCIDVMNIETGDTYVMRIPEGMRFVTNCALIYGAIIMMSGDMIETED